MIFKKTDKQTKEFKLFLNSLEAARKRPYKTGKIIEIDEPTKEECLNVLACKTEPYLEHINFFNEREGLPLMTFSEGCKATKIQVLYGIERYRIYAKENGWLQ